MGHREQVGDPALDANEPAAHGKHSNVIPPRDEVPAAQLMQLVTLVASNIVPGLQRADGLNVGENDGRIEGVAVLGCTEGVAVLGTEVGIAVGIIVGIAVLGCTEGVAVLGTEVGIAVVGIEVGIIDGVRVGIVVGIDVGTALGGIYIYSLRIR
jgi:hypothetical protein